MRKQKLVEKNSNLQSLTQDLQRRTLNRNPDLVSKVSVMSLGDAHHTENTSCELTVQRCASLIASRNNMPYSHNRYKMRSSNNPDPVTMTADKSTMSFWIVITDKL